MKFLTQWNRTKLINSVIVLVLLLVSFKLGSMRNASGLAEAHAGHEQAQQTEHAAITWTCSMHPQIQLPEPGQCPICFMDLIALSESEDDEEAAGAPRLTMTERAKALANIVTAPTVRRAAIAEVRMTGKIAFDETRVEMITARIDGRIDRLFVDYTGIPVTRGDHLAQIYSPELVSLQKELLVASRAPANTDSSQLVYQSIKSTFGAAREKLRLLGFSKRQLSSLLKRNSTTDHMTIRSSQQGVVVKKLVEEGSYVRKGAPLFHIADLRTLWVKLDAYETDLVWLRLGQTVSFTVEAWPGDTFSGAISFIDPLVDPATRTVDIRVIVDNMDGRLKPDMFVTANINAHVAASGGVKTTSLRGKWISPMHPQIVKDKPGTCDICGMPLVPAEELGYVTSGFENLDPLLIPATAPLHTGERAVVYVAVPETDKPTFEGRTIVLGPRVGSHYIVKSGLTEGEMVVVNGAFKIDGELQIRAKPSMMNPAAIAPPTDTLERFENIKVPRTSDEPVESSFLNQLGVVYEHYFSLAEALVKDEQDLAVKKLKAFGPLLSKVNAPETQRYVAWRTAVKTMRQKLEHVSHLHGMPEARQLFADISKQIIKAEKHFGHRSDSDHFLAFCPMAFNDKGAYWLQKQEGILNPYFGAKMLKCGAIKETYSASK
ncbi:MAG: DUF3347 domain-containing protein [Chitinivibrionales bacterium]|nr:DUF3347 domain-containing protein [Chitinivibrionales bacterium]